MEKILLLVLKMNLSHIADLTMPITVYKIHFDDEVKSKRLKELCYDVCDIFITMIKEELI